jgi:hypothetical protein
MTLVLLPWSGWYEVFGMSACLRIIWPVVSNILESMSPHSPITSSSHVKPGTYSVLYQLSDAAECQQQIQVRSLDRDSRYMMLRLSAGLMDHLNRRKMQP